MPMFLITETNEVFYKKSKTSDVFFKKEKNEV